MSNKQNTFHPQTAKFLAVLAENILGGLSTEMMQYWIENPKSLQEHLKFLLDKSGRVLTSLISSIHVDGAKEFKSADFFTTSNKSVKIVYLGNTFKSNFLEKIELDIPSADIKIHDLLKDSLDPRIISELGQNYETSLYDIVELLKLQPNGGRGLLLTNGCANVFYIRDKNNGLWAVSLRWYGGGWRFEADSVGDAYSWGVGSQIVSR